MEFGATLAPLLGPPVGLARSFRDWMGMTEQVCALHVVDHFVA